VKGQEMKEEIGAYLSDGKIAVCNFVCLDSPVKAGEPTAPTTAFISRANITSNYEQLRRLLRDDPFCQMGQHFN
jgi:hypothetical protein